MDLSFFKFPHGHPKLKTKTYAYRKDADVLLNIYQSRAEGGTIK